MEIVKWTEEKSLELATLGGGCFWCMEPIFKNLKGVVDVVVGYAGGNVPVLPMKWSVQDALIMPRLCK